MKEENKNLSSFGTKCFVYFYAVTNVNGFLNSFKLVLAKFYFPC